MLFKNKSFFIYWQGQLFSQIGSHIYLMVLILWLKQSYESPKILSNVLSLSYIPIVFFGIFFGAYIDWFSKKKIIVIADLLSGFALIITFLIFTYFDLDPITKLVVISVLTFLLGTGSCIFENTSASMIPEIVDKKDLMAANALNASTDVVGRAIAQLGSGFVFLLLGFFPIMLINGLSFIFSGVSEMFIVTRKKNVKKEKLKAFEELKKGLDYVYHHNGFRNYTLFSLALNFFIAFLHVTLPFYVGDYLGLDDTWFVYILAMQSLGMIFYSFSATIIRFSEDYFKNLNIGLALISVCLAGFIVKSAIFCLCVAGILGWAKSLINTNMMTAVQNKTESELLGRVLSIYHTICYIAIPAGIFFWGRIIELTNRNYVMIFLSSSLFFIMGVFFIFRNTAIKNYLKP